MKHSVSYTLMRTTPVDWTNLSWLEEHVKNCRYNHLKEETTQWIYEDMNLRTKRKGERAEEWAKGRASQWMSEQTETWRKMEEKAEKQLYDKIIESSLNKWRNAFSHGSRLYDERMKVMPSQEKPHKEMLRMNFKQVNWKIAVSFSIPLERRTPGDIALFSPYMLAHLWGALWPKIQNLARLFLPR